MAIYMMMTSFLQHDHLICPRKTLMKPVTAYCIIRGAEIRSVSVMGAAQGRIIAKTTYWLRRIFAGLNSNLACAACGLHSMICLSQSFT